MADDSEANPTRFKPLGSYRGLDAGPGWVRDSRASSSKAIDGTKQQLRDPRLGSPFTFRVVPPQILLDALLGNGQARTKDPFDPLLRKVFDQAQATYFETLAAFESGTATAEDVEAARQALAGGRSPASGQDIDIIESAMRANSNFSTVVNQRQQFKQSNFFATGPTRGATLARLDNLIAANGIDFNPRQVGQSEANQAAVSDLTQALDVIVQLNQMLATPPLTLLVNPAEMTITYGKKQSYQDRNRFNYIMQSWGEEQVRLSISGKSGGFVVGAGSFTDFEDVELGGRETNSVSGYQFASKWDSAAWQNLMGLFTIYRNNGYIYDTAGRPPSEAHLFIGNIEISYDQWVYVGNFENFSYNYTETNQHGAIDFSFEFVASFMYDRASSGPVEAITPPTPSPSTPNRVGVLGSVRSLPNQQAKTTRSFPNAPQDSSTAILDPNVNPFATNPLGNPARGRGLGR